LESQKAGCLRGEPKSFSLANRGPFHHTTVMLTGDYDPLVSVDPAANH
jgi:hypothetical protein